MTYLSYAVYAANGGAVSEAAFPRLEYLARQILDEMTHGRVTADDPVRDGVRYAMCALIDALSADAANMGREVQSISNDGVSVSYAPTSDARARYAVIAGNYLAQEATADGVPLLYAGVCV